MPITAEIIAFPSDLTEVTGAKAADARAVDA
jgi:hypothetical protein